MTLSALTPEQMELELGRLLEGARIRRNERTAEHPYRIGAPLTVFPQHEEEVVRVVKWAHERRVRLTPQGGGTKDAMGNPVEADVILSLRQMSGIVEHSVGDLTVTVLPGTTLAELQRTLGSSGQFLPLDPAWPEEATIGGIVSANASGPRRAMYGSARDYVIATRLVYPDGRVIRTGAKVVKNVAGYDMNKLFIGAMGTLAVLTEITLKIRPRPAYSAIAAVSGTEQALQQLQLALLDSQLEPSLAEWMNGTLAEAMGLPPAERIVVVGFDDVKSSVAYQMDEVQAFCRRLGVETIGDFYGFEETDRIYRAFGEAVPNANTADGGRAVVSVKLLSPLTEVPALCGEIQQAALRSGFDVRIHGGMYTGVSRATVETDRERAPAAAEWIGEAQAAARRRGGQAVVEFAPLELRRSVSVWGDAAPYDALMRGIKEQIDPQRILNSGRFMGGI